MENKPAFGTGGIRGIMGNGKNQINRHTIEHVTHGLAKAILLSDAPKSVGVAYDTRHNSAEFAQIVCEIISAFGIKTYTFDEPKPTPMLSHAIRLLGLGWGVVITASHNPKEYNGYKVYDRNGVQITDQTAAAITASIDSLDSSDKIPAKQKKLIKIFDSGVEKTFIDQIITYISSPFSLLPDSISGLPRRFTPRNDEMISLTPYPYPVVYSALHGTGASTIPVVLETLGFSPVCIQQNPDGAFGGIKTPNPEEPVVYEKALEEAEKINAKLLLATDPDCDRVGVMVKTEQGYKLLNGNQLGALLIDYLAQTRGVEKNENGSSKAVVISTIVSGILGELVSKDNNLEFVRLLTGFKYIGEYIANMPEDKSFFFGYEESYGFLAGDGARDKDAVIASALIVKMAAYYNKKGKTLSGRLQELYEKHGYCLENLYSAQMQQNEQKNFLSKLRSGIKIEGLIKTEDYSSGINGLPPADVLKLYFKYIDKETGSPVKAWAAIRPSGTEPKLKLYTGVHADTREAAEEALKSLTDKMISIIEE